MADSVRSIVGKLRAYTAAVARDLAVEVTANLREEPPGGTPVDTGWARANWIPTTGAPQTEPTGSPDSVSSAEQESAIAGLVTRPPVFERYYVANGVPYIKRLNDGSSTQSPSGFVQAAIEAAKASVTTKK